MDRARGNRHVIMVEFSDPAIRSMGHGNKAETTALSEAAATAGRAATTTAGPLRISPWRAPI
jgi:hypothetical protein